jgi:hypothetical protein
MCHTKFESARVDATYLLERWLTGNDSDGRLSQVRPQTQQGLRRELRHVDTDI